MFVNQEKVNPETAPESSKAVRELRQMLKLILSSNDRTGNVRHRKTMYYKTEIVLRIYETEIHPEHTQLLAQHAGNPYS